ncbi:MAG: hypothetical protein K1X51_01215 [Rhodospirillaceae bacterium]|nr:hypothetical protein [Rhodospirillaceae bacterium]
MAQAVAHDRRRLPRPTLARIAAFFCIAGASAALTLAGWTLFLDQMASVRGFKDLLITVILQSGLVVLGPLLLWAYLTLMPKGLLTAILRRLGRPFRS